MKKYLLALLLAPFFFSCDNSKQRAEVDHVKDSMRTVSQNLNGVIVNKDSTIETYIYSFNQIQDNLDKIKEKEKLISRETKSDVKNRDERIVSDIQMIYNLLAENKRKIARVRQQLKNSNTKSDELGKMLDHINGQVEEKDTQIAELKDKLEKMNIELSTVQTNYNEASQESGLKTEKMNTVFYAMGTSKELIKQGVLTKEGGFIGIGKSSKLKDNFNKDYFTKADASVIKEIPLAAKKAKVVTAQPSNSYKLEGEKNKKVDKLVITNPDEFWGTSRYLVIVVES